MPKQVPHADEDESDWSAEEAPWRNQEILRELYRERDLTQKEVADRLGCSHSTIRRWLSKHNLQKVETAHFITTSKGYERWTAWNGETNDYCKVHRLAAVAWFGYDAVVGKDVHHTTEVPWDNREGVLELYEPSEHSRLHRLAETEEQSKRRVNGEY